MLNGDIRSKVDALWNAFWTGGISNPLEVIEQITYLLFLKRLDDLHTLEENKATRLKLPKLERRVFPRARRYRQGRRPPLRGSALVALQAFRAEGNVLRRQRPRLPLPPHPRRRRFHLRAPHEGCALHHPHARPPRQGRRHDFEVPMEDRDTKGDLYEYMLGKIASAGQNGQFRTPRHIIQLMVELTAPTVKDVICDPACGTGGFLVAAGDYLRTHHPEIFRDAKLKKHFNEQAFHGFDFDNTMLRIGSMNMLLHGVENPDIRYRDSLAPGPRRRGGKIHPHPRQPALRRLPRLRELRQGPPADREDQEDRAALPRPLPAPAQARRTRRRHRARRRALRLVQRAQDPSAKCSSKSRNSTPSSPCPAACSSPTPASPPPSCSSRRRIPAARTTSGSTTWTPTACRLDDKRTELLPPEKLGPIPTAALTPADHAKNNLPDLLARWTQRDHERPRHSAETPEPAHRAREPPKVSACPKADLAAQGYDLSLNRYKEVVHAEVAHRPPGEILKALGQLEAEISRA
jgi:type I restriction enzyme M protein